MNLKTIFFLICTVSIMALLQAQPTAWRGKGSAGIYEETVLMKSWPVQGPEVLWRNAKLGTGHSSPAFANGKIYISGIEEETGYIYCLGQDGKILWRSAFGEDWTKNYDGSRSTPVIDGDFLYIYSGQGVLTCMDALNGAIKWEKNVIKELGGKALTWGVTETVVIDGEKLFVTPGGPVNNVVALNKKDGKLIWSCKAMGEQSAYCTPLLVKLPSRKLLVTITQKHIVGIDAETGKLLWSQKHTNTWSVHANTPLYHDNGIFCFSGYGCGGVRLNLNADGSLMTMGWYNPKFDSRIGGAVLLDGYIYGSGDNNREWQCLDWRTGQTKWVSKELAEGNLIYADGKFYIYSQRGELALVDATPSGMRVISKTKIAFGDSRHWAHLVINDGRLFLRHNGTLIAYKIK